MVDLVFGLGLKTCICCPILLLYQCVSISPLKNETMIFKSKLYLRCKDKSISSGKTENIFILIIENVSEKLWFYMIF